MIRQVIQRISNPEASIELAGTAFWLQCERAYTAADLSNMRAVNGRGAINGGHASLNPSQRLPPDRYFTEITVSHRMEL